MPSPFDALFNVKVEIPKWNAPEAEIIEPMIPGREWWNCQIGESWIVEDRRNRNPYLAASTHGRRTGKKFSCERLGDSMIIRRIA